MAQSTRRMPITLTRTALESVVILEPRVHGDARGFFYESYRKDELAALGIRYDFVQDNHSRSARGVLRGIHYQGPPRPQTKLVRCTAGRILDVAVDLRVGSPTLGKWVAVELSADNRRQLLVPAGFGHAFLTLSEVAEVQYKVDDYYAPEAEGAIVWNDPQLGVDWGTEAAPVVSARDAQARPFADYLRQPVFRVS